jgi:hypothetical protein
MSVKRCIARHVGSYSTWPSQRSIGSGKNVGVDLKDAFTCAQYDCRAFAVG